MDEENKYGIDLYAILVKPVYIGLLINILIPSIILFVAYYLDRSGAYHPPTQPPPELNVIFFVFLALSLAQGGVGLFLKHKFFMSPMIQSKGTFAEDFSKRTMTLSLIGYAFGDAIVIYGIIIYVLGGTFRQMALFVFIAFIAFQLIRPRLGFMKKALEAQEKFVEAGQYFTPKN